MKELKEIVKEDFTNKLDKKLTFDTSKLEINETSKKKNKWIIGLVMSCAIVPLVIISIPFIAMMEFKSSFSLTQKRYTLAEYESINNGSFKSLNEVNYPSPETKKLPISNDYLNAVNDFSYNIFSNIENKESNFAFSPLSLYYLLNVVSLTTNNSLIEEELDNVLGLDSQNRYSNMINTYKNNFFCNDKGTIQFYNSVFLSNKYNYNQEYIDELTKNYVEAFQLDFKKNQDLKKMLDWIDKKVNQKDFLKLNDLEITDLTLIYFFSTFYFNNRWSKPYSSKNNFSGDFFLSENNKVQTTYMNHEYYGKVMDYGDFIGCYDYYQNNTKIQYFVPKNNQKNIFSLTKSFDFFNQKYLDSDQEIKCYDNIIVDLTLPKFETTSQIDFSKTLKSLGLVNLFNKDVPSLNYAFNNLPKDTAAYLNQVKQKNLISFSEDGTTIRTVSYGAGNAADPMDVIEVKLNQPFVYIIYDVNDVPLFMGTLDNPTI